MLDPAGVLGRVGARAGSEGRRMLWGAAGPMGVAAVQFLATLALWGQVSTGAFGLFSFALVIVQLSFGLSNALVTTPISVGPREDDGAPHLYRCLSAHAGYVCLAGLAVAGATGLAGAKWGEAVMFGLLTVVGNLRWAARAVSLAREELRRSAASDGIYAITLAVLVGIGLVTRGLDVDWLGLSMVGANAIALIAAPGFLQAQWRAVRAPDLAGYRRHVWRDQAGWALGGVTTTELASNAQAYAVTAIGGAQQYAPLALGALFCRPLTIFLTALTQVDRPVFARHRREGAAAKTRALLVAALAAATLVWAANLGLALLALHLAAGEIAARGYHVATLRTIVLLWFAVMLLRAMRNPFSTALQARGAFRPLALASAAAALGSVIAAPTLATAGVAWSLLGALGGEVIFLVAVLRLYRRTSS